MLKTLIIIPFAILLTLPLANCGNAGDNKPAAAQTGILTGQRAPDFTLRDLGGKSFTLSELRNKKPVMLIFWATWCPACLQTMPYASDIHAQYSPRGLDVISINVASNDPLERVQRFQEARKLPYRILYDGQGEVSRTFAVFGIPTILIVDRHGIIQYRGNMLPTNVKNILDAIIAPAAS